MTKIKVETKEIGSREYESFLELIKNHKNHYQIIRKLVKEEVTTEKIEKLLLKYVGYLSRKEEINLDIDEVLEYKEKNKPTEYILVIKSFKYILKENKRTKETGKFSHFIRVLKDRKKDAIATELDVYTAERGGNWKGVKNVWEIFIKCHKNPGFKKCIDEVEIEKTKVKEISGDKYED